MQTSHSVSNSDPKRRDKRSPQGGQQVWSVNFARLPRPLEGRPVVDGQKQCGEFARGQGSREFPEPFSFIDHVRDYLPKGIVHGCDTQRGLGMLPVKRDRSRDQKERRHWIRNGESDLPVDQSFQLASCAARYGTHFSESTAEVAFRRLVDEAQQKRLLLPDVEVDASLGQPGGCRDVVDGRRFVALLAEEGDGGIVDRPKTLLPMGEIRRGLVARSFFHGWVPARTGWPGAM